MDKFKKKSDIALFIGAILMMGLFLFKYRNVVLACSDSMEEFILANLYGAKWGYERTMIFCLNRGRASYIFPAVVSLRYLVNSSGSYFAIWALQYIPIVVNVWLIAGIIRKHINFKSAMIFVIFFFTFLQVNVWHSLIICYPLDFMYGLFTMILGLYTFFSALNTEKKVSKVLKYILSFFLYYESMQAYEAFILAALVYAWLAFRHVYKMSDITGGKKFVKWFVSLIPHAAVAVIYLGIFVYLKKHPYSPDIIVLNPTETGSFVGFLKTWILFSICMFPMTGVKYIFDELIESSYAAIGAATIVTGIASVVMGILVGLILGKEKKSDRDEKENKAENYNLITMAVSGLIIAVFFPVLHATTSLYQSWVLEGGQYGYVPSTISYFGWATFLTCIILFWLGKIPENFNRRNILILVICLIGFGLGGVITARANELFYNIPGFSSAYWSLKGQAFHALVSSDEFKEDCPEVLYVPDYIGVHTRLDLNRTYMVHITKQETILVNDENTMREYIDQGYDCAAAYYVDDGELVYYRDVTGEASYLIGFHNGRISVKKAADVIAIDLNENFVSEEKVPV